jgi:hypothetical protein
MFEESRPLIHLPDAHLKHVIINLDSHVLDLLADFAVTDFPPPKNVLPGRPDAYLYVFCFVKDGIECPWYVGQTCRLSERMSDYEAKYFHACTDFRVGEVATFLREHFPLVVRYKATSDRRKEEKKLITELMLAGVRLLNSLPSYDYTSANEEAERMIAKRFCELLISSTQR